MTDMTHITYSYMTLPCCRQPPPTPAGGAYDGPSCDTDSALSVRARLGRFSFISFLISESYFVWRFCMGVMCA